ncbi:hypothetical protein E5D57_003006 [Metarhizium anisopliae]|nr:hypothetical protein E5D57_003006 [Metarhizium anisopliae]
MYGSAAFNESDTVASGQGRGWPVVGAKVPSAPVLTSGLAPLSVSGDSGAKQIYYYPVLCTLIDRLWQVMGSRGEL